jgi:hypothetical protein
MRLRIKGVPTIPREFSLRRVVMSPITKCRVLELTIFKSLTVLEKKSKM